MLEPNFEKAGGLGIRVGILLHKQATLPLGKHFCPDLIQDQIVMKSTIMKKCLVTH